MRKVLLFFLSAIVLLSADTVSFKKLTSMVSAEIKKNIYLDKDIKDYSVDINFADHAKEGQLYEFYKIVLFAHDLIMKYNAQGDFYYITNRKTIVKPEILPPKPVPNDKDKLHYYIYKIHNITNKDVLDCMSIFDGIKYKYLKQSDMIAYSATKEVHEQIHKILTNADKQVNSKTIKITIFSIDKNDLRQVGATINKLGLTFKSNGSIYSDLGNGLDKTFMFRSGFEADMFLSALERLDITKVNHSPKILLTNGVEADINSVANVRYLTGTASVDNQNNNTVRENYEFRDVGLKIKLLPKIKDDWVYLDMSLVSEEIVSYEKDNPTTGKISYKNSFKVKKGHPVLLTGINKTITKKRNDGVPVLRDIPIIKYLFSGSGDTTTERNINIMIEVL